MDSPTLLGRLVLTITWVDSILAVALALLLIARGRPYPWLAPPQAFRWAFIVGLIFSLGWWALLICWLYASEKHLGPYDFTGFRTYIALPATILGGEAGVAGLIGLAKPWRMGSLALAVANGLLTVITLTVIVRMRFFRG